MYMHSFSAQESGQRPLDSETISGIKIAVFLILTIVVLSSYLCLVILLEVQKNCRDGRIKKCTNKSGGIVTNKMHSTTYFQQQDFYEKVCRDTLW